MYGKFVPFTEFCSEPKTTLKKLRFFKKIDVIEEVVFSACLILVGLRHIFFVAQV